MTSKDLEAALGDTEDAFQRRPESLEVGLDHISDPAVLQLRKACRLLDAAGFLLDRNGHYTVIIESSFVAIERSIQFYVEEKGTTSPVSATLKCTNWGYRPASSHVTSPTDSKNSGTRTGQNPTIGPASPGSTGRGRFSGSRCSSTTRSFG